MDCCSNSFRGSKNLSRRSENNSKLYLKYGICGSDLGGAVLNETTSIGGSYLAKYFSGDDSLAEKKRHHIALEKYQKDYAKYQENREKLLDWQEQNRENNAIASQNFEDNNEALKLYNRTHPDKNLNLTEPVFSDYYRPSKNQKTYEMIYEAGGMALVNFIATRFLQYQKIMYLF